MKSNILYLCPNGLLEPLGRSQVLAYMKFLSHEFNFTVVSFEKEEDLKKIERIKEIQGFCDEHNICWIPKKFRKKNRIINKPAEFLVLLAMTLYLSLTKNISLIHCRSYIPTFAALICKKITGKKFIFDMRALLPEEMVTSKRIKNDSIAFKIYKILEKKSLENASHIISLTQAAIPHLENINQGSSSRITVIPTCVDLNIFSKKEVDFNPNQEKIVGSVGSVNSGWFPIEWLLDIYQVSKLKTPSSKLTVISRDSDSNFKSLAYERGVDLSLITFKGCEQAEVPLEMHKMTFGVVFNKSGLGRLGSFPTRMAEFLACGIPVIGNTGVGDVANIIKRYNVGVVVDNFKKETLAKAINELDILLQDPSLSDRCRKAAIEYFSAESGANSYGTVYKSIIKELISK
ncbi:glycosyltransferase [Vibrio metschnikovii]|uniref:glycosyltransferase n=1 Tax=Vibrio metschnikovii TaxID=28172 RepID=UPI003329AD25